MILLTVLLTTLSITVTALVIVVYKLEFQVKEAHARADYLERSTDVLARNLQRDIEDVHERISRDVYRDIDELQKKFAQPVSERINNV